MAAHAVRSGARIRRRGESEVASCSCGQSPANGTSPGHQRRRRAGGWKSQRDEYTRRDSEVPARVRRTGACSRPPRGTSRVGGSNLEIASAEPGRQACRGTEAVRRSVPVGALRGTCRGRPRAEPPAGGRTGHFEDAPIGRDPQTSRPPRRRNERGDEGIRAHNTLSAETTHVQVFYPFHPLQGVLLQIVRKPKRGDGAVSIIEL